MKKYSFGLLALLIMSLAFVACSEDDLRSVPPTFKGFKVSPNPVHPGDTVTISAVYNNKGEYVYAPKCTWILKLDTLTESSEQIHAELIKSIKATIAEDTLSVKFAIPKTAKTGRTVNCSFNASYSNAVDTEPGLSLPNTTIDPFIGRFGNSRVSSILYSECSGDCTFGIVD